MAKFRVKTIHTIEDVIRHNAETLGLAVQESSPVLADVVPESPASSMETPAVSSESPVPDSPQETASKEEMELTVSSEASGPVAADTSDAVTTTESDLLDSVDTSSSSVEPESADSSSKSGKKRKKKTK